MNFLQIFKEKENNYLSPISNPFIKDSIESVSLFAYRISNSINVTGSVTFKNQDTEGEQKFKANTLDECLNKIKIFIENL